MRPPREDTLPWYKQFWPWFLISLPASVVVASIITINLAVTTSDGLVHDDYYKKGLAIHKDADSTARAKALGIASDVQYTADTGALTIMLNQTLAEQPRQLKLAVVHPTLPGRDQEIMLTAIDDQRFAGRLDTLPPGQWKLQLQPIDGNWRVTGRLPVPGDGRALLD